MTAIELQDLLVHILSAATGGSPAHWAHCVGQLKVLSVAKSPRCNWRVNPTGTEGERDAIVEAYLIVSEQHPYIDR